MTRFLVPLQVLWLAVAGLSGQAPDGPRQVRVFSGARVMQDGGAWRVADVVVRDGRIDRVLDRMAPAPGMERVDLAGKFLMPGFISAHSHVTGQTEAELQRKLAVFARYGITTVLSLGGEQAPAFTLREAQQASTLGRARIFAAGPIVTGATADAARAAVGRAAAMQADIIKIRVDDNLGTGTKMAPEVYRAVIDEAHRLRLRVAAHVFYLEDAKALLRAGVDMIAHSVRDRQIDDEFIALMKARNVPYCPTLTREVATFVYGSTPSFFSDPFFLREADAALVAQLQEPARQAKVRQSKSAQAYRAALDVAARNLKRASDAGVLIAMGTDSGAFPERFEGYFEHLEMEMMAEAGLTPAQVLRAATIDAARTLGVDDIGRVTPGAWADFVVLDRDPLDEVRNTRSIASVWIAGNRVGSK
jgi:imidazolonepropionase-like amidohydrolase